MNCYYHLTDSTDPYHNLALEELLLGQVKHDEVILYLWQNADTVVIGRNQNAWKECRLDAFAAQGGRLARRLSGGGAVYHDLGNQNFTFLAGNAHYDVSRQTEVIRRAVASFGIEAEISGRNDIQVGGRKFSGNAYHQGGGTSFHHGTILINSDLQKLDRYLMPSQEKLRAKGVESVRGRVMNLSEETTDITPEGMRRALLTAFEAVYGEAPSPLPSDRVDPKALDALEKQYASDEWRIGKLSALTFGHSYRFSFGELSVHFAVQEGVVQSVQLFSDAMDALWIEELKKALPGLAFSAEVLARAVPESGMVPGARAEVAAYFMEILLA